MIKYLRLEVLKLKRRKIFLTLALVLGVEMMFLFLSYGNNRNFLSVLPEVDGFAWEYLITGMATLNGLFMPMLTAVFASRICDIEHKGNTWKLLQCNNQSRASIFDCKLMVLLIILVTTILLQTGFWVIYGKAMGIVQPLPLMIFMKYLLATLMLTVSIALIQHFFSLLCKNQLIPMSIGMVGSLIGFISALLPSPLRNWLIWGNYAELLILTPEVSAYDPDVIQMVHQSIDFMPFVILLAVTVGLTFGFRHAFQQAEC